MSLLVLMAAVAILAPFIAPYDPTAIDLGHVLAGPSGAHLLGTDQSGRDILSRLLWGARPSMLGALGVVAIATVSGTTIGVFAAMRGRWIDAVIGRMIDFSFSFPGLILAILAVALFGPGLVAPMIALAFAYTPYLARLARSAALVENERPYMMAVRIQGLSEWAVAIRHLIPNILPIILAQATVDFGYALIDLAALSYLGLGVQPPTADWGLMIAQGQAGITNGAPEQALFAGAMIVLTVVAFNLVGDQAAMRIGRRDR